MSVPRQAFKRSLRKLYDYLDLQFVEGATPIPDTTEKTEDSLLAIGPEGPEWQRDINVNDLEVEGALTKGGNAVVVSTEVDASGYGFVIDEDDLSSDSDLLLPTQQSVKAYVDTEIGAITAYAEEVEDGALDLQGVVVLTKDGVGAYTLAAPAADDDGKQLIITNGSANAHVVTAAADIILDGTGTDKDTITFDAQIGASIHLVCVNETYHVVSEQNVTLSDEST